MSAAYLVPMYGATGVWLALAADHWRRKDDDEFGWVLGLAGVALFVVWLGGMN